MPNKKLATLAAVGALLVAAPAAHAGQVQPDASARASAGADADLPAFGRAFLNRVWKFRVEIDDVGDPGQLEVTIDKLLNVPKGMRAKADALVDQRAIVVLSGYIRIYKNGKPAGPGGLSDLIGDAVIHGKLLAPSRWEKDRHGDSVPTIRADRIYT